MSIRFHPLASEELERASRWYGTRSEEARKKLASAVDAAVAEIVAAPDRFLKIGAQHRACSVAGFPYQIVFRIRDEEILVVAVAHAKRRPGYWHRRK